MMNSARQVEITSAEKQAFLLEKAKEAKAKRSTLPKLKLSLCDFSEMITQNSTVATVGAKCFVNRVYSK